MRRADLSTLLGIEITDYLLQGCDCAHGNAPLREGDRAAGGKGFPASHQKAKPVRCRTFTSWRTIRDGWIALATDLKQGERVKSDHRRGAKGVYEVLEVQGRHVPHRLQAGHGKGFRLWPRGEGLPQCGLRRHRDAERLRHPGAEPAAWRRRPPTSWRRRRR